MTFATIDEATAAIEAHPVCSSLMVGALNLTVFFPLAYVMPGGITVQRGLDDLAAYQLLYDRIDDFWNRQRLQIPAQ